MKLLQQPDKNISLQELQSWPYHLLDWLVTVMQMNKVTRNWQLPMVGLTPLMLQKIVYTEHSYGTYHSPLFYDMKSSFYVVGWYWKFVYIQIMLTYMKEADNFGFTIWIGVIKTTWNIGIECPHVFNVGYGPIQSYYWEYGW